MTVITEQKLHEFRPDAENTRQLRDAFGRFTTGVTIVTAMTKDGPIAITANSFSSVSLSPALVLWAPSKNSKRFVHFENASQYAIHVLAEDQDELCWRIAKDAYGLTDADITISDAGVPVLIDSLACFECTQNSVIDAGDHAIVVGEVTRASYDDSRRGLGFFAGQMGVFVPKE